MGDDRERGRHKERVRRGKKEREREWEMGDERERGRYKERERWGK